MSTVSILSCDDYDHDKIKSTLLKSIENLGGLKKYIAPSDKVLLKVNLLMKKTPEEATTTHPVFVQCLAEILLEYGAKVLIGDSPGGPFNEWMLKSIYKATGMQEAALMSGAELNFNTKSMEVTNPKGLILKKLTVTEMLKDVDKVISVSKLKTHGMAKMTGAVKNMFGTIPGALKAEYHLTMPNISDFANALIDICLYSSPVLCFMDAVVGMEGDGPSSGTPRKIGAVLASDNPFDLDYCAAHIIHIPAQSVPTIQLSIERGDCAGDFKKINLSGDPIDHFVIKDFKTPKIININPYKGKIPPFAQQLMEKHLQPRPVFKHDKCIGCQDCYKNCPPKAIEMIDHRPIVNLETCIRCFCCQELCPEKAVEIYRPLLFKFVSKI